VADPNESDEGVMSPIAKASSRGSLPALRLLPVVRGRNLR
jgi:hypothetical protein